MAIGKSDSVHYQNIADSIRRNLSGAEGGNAVYFPAEMAGGVNAVAEHNYQKGYTDGGGGAVSNSERFIKTIYGIEKNVSVNEAVDQAISDFNAIKLELGNRGAVVSDIEPTENYSGKIVEVYDKGAEVGYSSGKEAGITEGFETGKQAGITEGYNTGKAEGYNSGYQIGKVDGNAEGYQNGFTDGKCTLSGTYVFKERISASDLPNITVEESFADKDVCATFEKEKDVYEVQRVNRMYFGTSSTPKLVVESTKKYTSSWDYEDYPYTIAYDFTNNYWSFHRYIREIALNHRSITFNEPVIVSEEFYNAFVSVLEPVLDIYDKGNEAGRDELWDVFQCNGTRPYYADAFRGTSFEYIRPKYKIVPTEAGGAVRMFYDCDNLKKIEAEYFDLSKLPRGRYAIEGMYYTFTTCSVLEEIEDIGLSPSFTYVGAFNWCSALKTIAKITVDENTQFDSSTTFGNCNSLEEVRFEGIIGQNGLNFQWSKKLSKASWQNIIGVYAVDLTLSMTGSKESVNKAFETSEGANDGSTSAEWLNLLATRPNLTVNLI